MPDPLKANHENTVIPMLFYLFVRGSFSTELAVFIKFKLALDSFFVLKRCVPSVFTSRTEYQLSYKSPPAATFSKSPGFKSEMLSAAA